MRTGLEAYPKPGRAVFRSLFLQMVLIVLLAPAFAVPTLSDARKAWESAPDSPTARKVLLEKLLQAAQAAEKENRGEAGELYREAAELSPGSAVTFRRWGFFLFRNKQFAQAIPPLESALDLDENHHEVIRRLGFALVEENRHEEAVAHLEQALEMKPDDFFAWYQLGSCHFLAERFQQALRSWESALEKVPEGSKNARGIQQRLRQVREKLVSSGTGKTIETERFIIHFAGNSHLDLQGLTRDILWDMFLQITNDVKFRPATKIEVMFFRTTDFYAANQAQAWVGGLAQGNRILIPLRQGYDDLPAVKGLLAHELTHVIVNHQTRGLCPTWIHEGLAGFEELQASHGDPLQIPPALRKLFGKILSQEVRFPELAGVRIGKEEEHSERISLAYLASFLGIRYLVEHEGRDCLPVLLNALGKNIPAPAAIEKITGLDERAFQAAVVRWTQSL